MKTNDVFPSKFLKAADIGEGGRILTVSSVAVEEVGDDQKPVARFNGEKKGLVLNRTNWDRLAHSAGSDESSDWTGLKVELYCEIVSFGGKSAPAIRVRAARAARAPTKPKIDNDPPDWTTEEIPAA
jgi:hypothetical protein